MMLFGGWKSAPCLGQNVSPVPACGTPLDGLLEPPVLALFATCVLTAQKGRMSLSWCTAIGAAAIGAAAVPWPERHVRTAPPDAGI